MIKFLRPERMPQAAPALLLIGILALFSLVVLVPAVSAYGQEPDSGLVAPPDSAEAREGPVSAAPEDSASADSLMASPIPAPGAAARSDSASTRSYDPRLASRLAPFSGKSAGAGRDDFHSLSTTTPGEAFAFEPGTGLVEYGSAGLPQVLRVRGSRPRDVKYLLDGIPVTDDRLEIFDLNWLPLAGAARAEVALHGQSGLFGSGATGGVMNLTTVSAMPAVPLSEVVAWWGSFDSRAVHFRFNRRITSAFGLLLAYENLHSGGWIESSTANSNKFYGKLTGYIGRGLAYNVVGYRYDGSIELPDSCAGSSDTSPIDRDDKRDLLAVSIASLSDVSVRLDYYYLGTEQEAVSGDVSRPGEGRMDGIQAVTAWATPDSLYADIGAGFKRYERKYGRNGIIKHEVSTSDVYGYVAGEKPFDEWRIRGSFRLERNSRDGAEFAGDLSASYKAFSWCLLRGRIDRSFAYRTLRECELGTVC